jgi:hypothetical protein
VKNALRWVVALVLTWFLSATILASLIARFGVDSIGFAFLLNMVLPMWILAFFAIADPDVDHPWLAPYFRTRRWEQDGERYLAFGVLRFQAFLKKYRIGIFGLRRADFRVKRDALFFARMERETRASEAAHGVCFLVVGGFALYAAFVGSVAGVVWLLVTGVVCQVYPMLLQRYHRPRWQRATLTSRKLAS